MSTEKEGTGVSRTEKHIKHPKKKKRIRKKAVLIIICAILILVCGGLAMAGMSIKPPSLTTPLAEDPEEQVEREDGIYNVLVVGTDKVGLNTDTILVMSLDTLNDRANVMSIPRDTMSNVKRSVKKINAAYAVGAKNGKGNIDNLKEEVSYLLGFEVDNYVVVNLSAFEEIIDAIGGVTVEVPRNMNYDDPYQDLHIHLNAGLQTLNGEQAIGMVRYRSGYAEGDLGRVKTQQLFIQAVAKQLASPSTLTKVPKLVEIVLRNMDTDLTNGEIVWLAKEAMTIDMETNLNMFVLPGAAQYVNKLSYYLPNEAEILTIVNEYFNPYATPITNLNIVDVSNIVQQEQSRQSALTAEQKRREEEEQERIENEATVNVEDLGEEVPSEGMEGVTGTEGTAGAEGVTGPEGTVPPTNVTGETTPPPTEVVPGGVTEPSGTDPTTPVTPEQTQPVVTQPTETTGGTTTETPSTTDPSGYNTIPGEVLKPEATGVDPAATNGTTEPAV